MQTHVLGINPGGEVQGCEWPNTVPRPPDKYLNQLLTKAECTKINAYIEKAMN
jgi:hypothetical protein